MASTIELVHAFTLDVVAEGVEDQSTLDLLEGFRCDCARGFHLGRPLPADEFGLWALSHGFGAGAPLALA